MIERAALKGLKVYLASPGFANGHEVLRMTIVCYVSSSQRGCHGDVSTEGDGHAE